MKDTLFLKELGKRIAQLRKQNGKSQEEFAEISGKMINTISNIERGISDPKISTLLALSQALDINVLDLLSETKQKSLHSPVLESIINTLTKQDEKTLKIIQKQIQALLELKQ